MMALVRIELDKALRNRWFAIALGVGVLLALVSAGLYIVGLLTSHFTPEPDKWYNPTFQSCFNAWMSIDQSAPSLLFYQILPLLAVIPYAWSLRAELKDGYISQVYSRARRGRYFAAKYFAVFCAAGLVAALPQVPNLLLLACFFPGYLPQVESAMYTGVFWNNVGSWLFYSLPLLDVALFCAIDFALCGVWAGFVLALSCLVRNRVVLLVAPYLALLIVQFVNERIFLALGALNGFDVGLFNNMRATQTSAYVQDGRIMLIEMIVLFVASWGIALACKKRDAL